MPEVGILIILFAAGAAVLIAEIFLPSHGVLSIVGVGLLVAAVWKTFTLFGRVPGIVATLVLLVALPVFAVAAIKVWPLTPVGKRIAPPNPQWTAGDGSVPVDELRALVGQTGRSLTALRPVGTCEFHGRRFSCVAQYGLIDPDKEIEATGISGGNLRVVEKTA